MRVAVLAVLVSLAQVTWSSAADERGRRDRRGDDMREMREALATLSAVIEAASRPASRVDDAPWLIRESLRSGVIDPVAMGAIVRWFLYEKEEKVAGALADALDELAPRLQGVDGHHYGAAARSVIGAFQGALRDAEHNRRRNGDAVLRDVKPAIDAAVAALREAQERLEGAPAPEPSRPEQPVANAPPRSLEVPVPVGPEQ
jgi:hypothetical protein